MFRQIPVSPLSPPAPWTGGKRNLAAALVARIQAIPHTLYAEPFLGMGGVFFRRRMRPKIEVINDLSRDVANFFRILQRHEAALLELLSWQLTGRAEFERLARQDPATLTDLDRAARFYCLQRMAFGGKAAGRSFGTSKESVKAINISRQRRLLEKIHARLEGVMIECLPFGDFITQYDRAGALFYLDPPYFNSENDYGKGLFARGDFKRLAVQLAGINGRFILSLNDTPEVRAIFAAFEIDSVETTYTMAKGAAKTGAKELIITDGPRPGDGMARQGALL